MSETSESGTGAAAKKARDVQEKIGTLDLRDRMILFGSVALVVLFFLPWWSVSVKLLGIEQSESMNGLKDLGWVGFLAAMAAIVAMLANMGLLPFLPSDVRSLYKRVGFQVGMTAVALLAGPLYFWSQAAGSMSGGMEGIGVAEAGKTLFFWLALLAALTAAGGAAWKMADSAKS